MYDLHSGVRSADEVGGKAHHLMNLAQLGVAIPPGFVLPTNWASGELDDLQKLHIHSHVRKLAHDQQMSWGAGSGAPLVVSVRSGAPVSMPGMMETILNVGLTRNNLDKFAASKENCSPAFVHDCYRRLIQMYGTTVKGIEKEAFGQYYDAAKVFWLQINESAAKKLVEMFERVYQKETGEDFPDTPSDVLSASVGAVFKSWTSPKAQTYREIEGISHDMGTAVVIQQMVFGNTGPNSGTGVVFTHNPNTGVKGLYGDFLLNAQGEDVVAGTHKTLPVKKLITNTDLKQAGKKLQNVLTTLFAHYTDMVDVEFTIEEKNLWILQARIAKRSRRASIRSCLDMVRDGAIPTEAGTEMIMKLIPQDQTAANCPDDLSCVGNGVGVTEGVVAGRVAIGKDSIKQFIDANEPYVYVAKETAPDDSFQMKHAVGILTAQGGTLSHAAVVARSWNKCCVVGFEDMKVEKDSLVIDTVTAKVGDWIKINGVTGEVYL